MTKREEIENYFEESSRRRKQEFIDNILNPVADFDPETFDPASDNTEDYQLLRRKRVEPPRELPTMGMKPKELLQGQMIGMYESKQDLYLLFANKFNELQRRIDDLEKIINNGKELKNKV